VNKFLRYKIKKMLKTHRNSMKMGNSNTNANFAPKVSNTAPHLVGTFPKLTQERVTLTITRKVLGNSDLSNGNSTSKPSKFITPGKISDLMLNNSPSQISKTMGRFRSIATPSNESRKT
jgi:hypothetical protein